MKKQPTVLTDQGITPQVGQLMEVHGQLCKIVAVHDFGTVDVESPSGRYWWRVTGLPFIKPNYDQHHIEYYKRCREIYGKELIGPKP